MPGHRGRNYSRGGCERQSWFSGKPRLSEQLQERNRHVAQNSQEQDPIVAKAVRDAAFRQRLLSNPKAALQAEFGSALPPEVNIHIHVETPTDVHIVIPGEAPGVTELSDADLEQAVGGMMCKYTCCTCGASTHQTIVPWDR